MRNRIEVTERMECKEGVLNFIASASFARRVRFAVISAAFCALFGCSSSIFTSDDGKEFKSLKGNGQFNSHCLSLQLPDATLNNQQTRGLVDCLNSNGSIQEYADLVHHLDESQLSLVIAMLNDEILSQPARLKQIDKSFAQLDERGIVDKGMEKLSKLLANPRLIRSGIQLLRQGASVRSEQGKIVKLDPAIVKSIRILADELASNAKAPSTKDLAKAPVKGAADRASPALVRSRVAEGLELGIRLSSTQAYKSLVNGLNSSIGTLVPGFGLKFLTKQAHEYLKAKIAEPEPLGKLVLWGIADGSLPEALNDYNNKQCDEGASGHCETGPFLSADEQIQSLESFIKLLALDHAKPGDIFEKMTVLFRVMDAPISCMAGTKALPNADMVVMDSLMKQAPLDVPQWSMRTNMLKIKVASGVCELPKGPNGEGFNELLRVLRTLSDHKESAANGDSINRRPLVTIAHFLNALKTGDELPLSREARADLAPLFSYPENERYRRFLIHWLGDKNPAVNVYTHLSSALAELSRPERAILGNVLYFLNVLPPGSSDLENVRKITDALMRLHPELATDAAQTPGTNPMKTRSVYDVLSGAVLKIDNDEPKDGGALYQLFLSLSEFIDSKDDYVHGLLSLSREALLVNDVSPFLDIAMHVAQNAEKNEALFNVLFDLADSPEFEAAMQLTAKMAGNGSLKELLKGMLAMFRSTSERAPGAPPALMAVSSVRLAEAGRDHWVSSRWAYNPKPAAWPASDQGVAACYDVNLDWPLSHPASEHWADQMSKVGACIDANNQNAELARFIDYGLKGRVKEGTSLLALLTEMIASVIPDHLFSGFAVDSAWGRIRAIYDEFSDLLLDDPTVQDLKAMGKAFDFLLSRKYCGTEHKEALGDEEAASTAFPGTSCPDEQKLSVVQGLARLSSSLTAPKQAHDLQELLEGVKPALVDPKLGKSIALIYHASDDADKDARPVVADEKPAIKSAPLSDYPRNNDLHESILRVARENGIAVDQRLLARIKDDFYKQPWQTQYLRYKENGREKIGFRNSEEFKKAIKPLLDELSVGTRLDAFLTFLFRMYNNPYTPEWWADWFTRMASNVRAIPYYYPGMRPGRDKPVIRLVSQLDLFDLVVTNADFMLSDPDINQVLLGGLVLPVHENFAIKYLTLLGLSGDDPSSGANITHVVDTMIREIDSFYTIVSSVLVNNPLVKIEEEVKRRVYNLHAVMPIFQETNHWRHFTQKDGTKVRANDLGFLRDLFKSILRATPGPLDANRNPELYRRDYNPLAIICDMVKFGVFRNITANLWHQANGAAVANDITPLLRFSFEAMVVSHPGRSEPFLNSNMMAVLDFLLHKNCDQTAYQNLPCVMDKHQDPRQRFNDRYVVLGKVIDAFFEWIKDDERRQELKLPTVMTIAKRAGYDLLYLLDSLGRDGEGRSNGLASSFARVIRPLLGTEAGAALLVNHIDLAQDLLTDPKIVRFLENLLTAESSGKQRGDEEYKYADSQAFEDLKGVATTLLARLGENEGRGAEALVSILRALTDNLNFNPTRHAIQWLKDDPDYLEFKLESGDRILENAMAWLPKEGRTSVRERALRLRLQETLGEQIDNKNLLNLILFVGRESTPAKRDAFYDSISFIGDQGYINKFNDFLDLMREGLADTYLGRR